MKMRLLDNECDLKPFRLDQLFEIRSAKGKSAIQLQDGNDVPYFAASKERNGFNRMVSSNGIEDWISDGNCIQLIHTGDAAAGWANYVPGKFIGIKSLSSCAYNENLDVYSGNFLATLIRAANNGKYSHKNGWSLGKAYSTSINIPVDTKGEPNWIFMTEYMKMKIQLYQKKLLSLSLSLSELKRKSKRYGKFKVKELFEIVNGKSIVKKELSQTRSGLPAVQSGATNFGIIGYLDLECCRRKRYVYSLLPCLTVARSGSAGYVGVHEKCVVGDSAKLLKPKFNNSSLDVLLFIRVSLMVLSHKYSYQDKVTETRYGNEEIALPMADDDRPDWRFMQNCMRSLIASYQVKLESLNFLARSAT